MRAVGAWVWAPCHCQNPGSSDGSGARGVELETAWEAKCEGMGLTWGGQGRVRLGGAHPAKPVLIPYV